MRARRRLSSTLRVGRRVLARVRSRSLLLTGASDLCVFAADLFNHEIPLAESLQVASAGAKGFHSFSSDDGNLGPVAAQLELDVLREGEDLLVLVVCVVVKVRGALDDAVRFSPAALECRLKETANDELVEIAIAPHGSPQRDGRVLGSREAGLLAQELTHGLKPGEREGRETEDDDEEVIAVGG